MNETGKITGTTSFWLQPKSAGCYRFGGDARLFVKTRPRWLTRVLMKWLIEWEWEDAK